MLPAAPASLPFWRSHHASSWALSRRLEAQFQPRRHAQSQGELQPLHHARRHPILSWVQSNGLFPALDSPASKRWRYHPKHQQGLG